MVDRSLYPNNVVVDQQTLTFTETSKSQAIKDVYVDIGSAGILSGGVITPASNPTLINVSACRGRTPNGELIQLPAQTSKSLAAYAAGVVNYVCALYTEDQTVPRASQLNGDPLPTRVVGVSSLMIMTLTELTFLPTTSSDMTAPARDRLIILGTVTSPGPGAAITTSAITTISSAPSTLGVQTDDLVQMTGLAVTNVARGTLPGQATLAWNGTTLTYTAPSDFAGVAQAVGAAGVYTLPSGTPAQTLTVYVNPQLLPQVSGTLSVNFEILDVYGEEPAVAGARDEEHRRLTSQGFAGAPTQYDPHGVGLYSMQAVERARGSIELGATLTGAAGSLTARLFATRATSTTSVRELISQWETGTPNMYIRRYVALIGGEVFEEIVTNARWTVAGQWVEDVVGAESTYIYSSSNPANAFGVGFYSGVTPFAQSAWTYRFQTTSNGISTPQEALAPINPLFPGITMAFTSSAPRAILYESIPSGGGLRSRIYMRADGGIEIVTNALWNGSQWLLDNILLVASRFRLGASGFFAEVYPPPGVPASSPFNEASWYSMFSGSGTLTAPNIISAAGRLQTVSVMAILGVPTTGSTFTIDGTDLYVSKDAANGGTYIIPFALPTGATLVSVILNLNNVAGTGHQANVVRTSSSSGVQTLLLSPPYTAFANGANDLTVGGFVPGLNVISSNYGYGVVLSSASGGGRTFHAFTLTISYTVQEYT